MQSQHLPRRVGHEACPWPDEGATGGDIELMPACFDAYALVLNPLAEDGTGFVTKHLKAWLDPRGPEGRPAFTWRKLAEELDIPYDSDLPQALWELEREAYGLPMVRLVLNGDIHPQVLEPLLTVLAGFTGPQRCCFYFSALYIFDDDPDFKGRCYDGPLESVSAFHEMDEVRLHTPSAWWPEDRRWKVISGYDDEHSLIGGPNELIDGLCASPDMEVVRFPKERLLPIHERPSAQC